jgi:phosphate uptake regulator
MACVRILNKRGYKEAKKSLQIYDVIKQLERIADEYKYICDILFNKKPKKEILELFKSVNEYYNTFYQMFYKFSPDLKEKIYLNKKKLLEQGDGLLKKTAKEESLLIHYLLNIIDKTYDAAGEYFALML